MLKHSLFSLLSLSIFLGGCSTTDYYSAHITATDAHGIERPVVIQWKRTRHFLRNETAGGEPISLRVQCSRKTLPFSEKEDGIRFRNDARTYMTADSTADSEEKPQVCGEVLDHRYINEIHEGPLRLTVLCHPIVSRRSTDPRAKIYLPGRKEPYVFEVEKTQEDPEAELNALLKCAEYTEVKP